MKVHTCPSVPVADRANVLDTYPKTTPVNAGVSDYPGVFGVVDNMWTFGTPTLTSPYPGKNNAMGVMSLDKVPYSAVTDGLSNSLLLCEVAGRPDVWKGRNNTRVQITINSAWSQTNCMNLQGVKPDTFIAYGRCMVNCTNNYSAYSFHNGGVNVTMGDGSVRFLRDSIDAETFAALCTRSGGEVVTLD